MADISALIILHPAVLTPTEAADLLAVAPTAEFDANIGALEVGLRASGINEEDAALRDFYQRADAYFRHRSGGDQVRAFGSRQRLLNVLKGMDHGVWRRGRQTFVLPRPVSLFEAPGKVRFRIMNMLGKMGPGKDWEEVGQKRVEAGEYAAAVAAFWRGAAEAEQIGGEREAAHLYRYAAEAFHLEGKQVEAYVLNATAQWYARLGQDEKTAGIVADRMREILAAMRSSLFSRVPEDTEPVFAEMLEGFELALQNRFRSASAKLKKAAVWFSKHHHRFAAGHLYKFLGDLFIRGGHSFPAMMAYAHAGLEMEKAPFLPGIRLLKRRYVEAFAWELGTVGSAEELLDQTIAIYQREIRRHRSLGEKELEAQALSNLIKNLLEEGRKQERDEETVEALRRAAHLYQQLGQPSQAAAYFHQLGRLLWGMGGPLDQKVLKAFDHAFKLYDGDKRCEEAAAVLFNRAAYLMEKGNYLPAGLRFLSLAEYYEIQGEAAYEPAMDALMDAVSAFKAGGAMERALLTLEKYMNKAHRQKDNDRVGTGWILFGDILVDNKQYPEALRAFYRAHEIFLESEGGQSMAVSCLAIMSYYLEIGGEMEQSALTWRVAVHQTYHRVGEAGAAEGYVHFLLAEYLEGAEKEAHAAAHYAHAARHFQKSRDARAPFAYERCGKLQMELGLRKEAASSLRLARFLHRFFVDDKGVERVERLLAELYGIN